MDVGWLCALAWSRVVFSRLAKFSPRVIIKARVGSDAVERRPLSSSSGCWAGAAARVYRARECVRVGPRGGRISVAFPARERSRYFLQTARERGPSGSATAAAAGIHTHSHPHKANTNSFSCMQRAARFRNFSRNLAILCVAP